MGKEIKIFEDNREIYRGQCSVNTVIFRGWIYGNYTELKCGGLRFILRLSNGQNKETGEWYKPTFAECTAFGNIAERISKEYKEKDEIWIIAKYYSKQVEDKYYKGFIVREIITKQEIEKAAQSLIDDDLPF